MFSIEVERITSVSGPESNSILLYPNPASERLILEGDLDSDNIVLLAADGREYRLPEVYATDRKYQFDIRHIPSGMYVVRIGHVALRVLVLH